MCRTRRGRPGGRKTAGRPPAVAKWRSAVGWRRLVSRVIKEANVVDGKIVLPSTSTPLPPVVHVSRYPDAHLVGREGSRVGVVGVRVSLLRVAAVAVAAAVFVLVVLYGFLTPCRAPRLLLLDLVVPPQRVRVRGSRAVTVDYQVVVRKERLPRIDRPK